MRCNVASYLTWVAVVFLVAAPAAGEVAFTRKPTARATDGGVSIAFAVAAPTDVEVAVLDGKGAVARHLAAGVLGGAKPPPAPLRPGLAQTLVWDLKDDLGRPAGGGPFKVRVRAGTGVTFGRLIGADPYTFGVITGIATDDDGNLYVMANGGVLNQRQVALRVFDANGRYLRELIPFPADLAPEAVGNLARWDPERKAFRPRNFKNLNPEFYPGGQEMRLVSVSRKAGVVMTTGASVCRMGLDGGRFTGPAPMWSRAAGLKNPAWNIPQLAVSPDGRYVYYSNVAGTQYQPKTFADTDPKWPQGRVYRQDTTEAGADPQPFYDLELPDWEKEKYWLPDAWNKRTAAYGIDVDAAGHLYVCDLVNQAVVEVDPAGKKVTSTAVAWPEQVHVNSGTGDYYLISRTAAPRDGRAPRKLLKVVGRGATARVAAEWTLPGDLGDACALVTTKDRPLVWLGGSSGLVCVEDQGEAFAPVETAFRPRPEGQLDWNRMAVDPRRDQIYVNDGASRMWRYEGRTGEGGLLKSGDRPFYATDLAVGYDGLLYVRTGYGYALGSDYSGPFARYTADLQPAPYEATGTHVLSKYIYSRYGIGYAERGIGVGPDGTAYISFMYDWVKYCIAGFGPDGRPLKGRYLEGLVGNRGDERKGYPPDLTSAVIGPITGANGGIRVDLKGDIYVGMWLWPKEVPVPAEHAKDDAYLCSVGSVFKFTPAGGFVTSPTGEWSSDPLGSTPRTPGAPGIEVRSGGRTPTLFHDAFVEGAVAAYPGYAPFSHANWGGNSCCVCRVGRFDLDRYGRLVMPNAITNSVQLLDNAGNRILEFGAYGNFDSRYVNPNVERGRKGDPTVVAPEVPLAWPTGAGLSDGHIYVNDTYSRRAVRVDTTWAAEALCPVE